MQQATLPRRTLRPLFLALCLLPLAGGLPTPARADIQQPAKGRTKGEREQQKLARRLTPPPAPVPASVRVEPGGRAEIVLQANGSLGLNVEFILRTPPAHGTFEGTPRRIDRNRVAVMYLHRAADGPGHDTFSFAAQAPGTPVSSAETVDIEVSVPLPPPGLVSANAPDLAATPTDLDFGAVETGRFSGVTLTLENRGAGQAVGQLEPPAPWAVEGDPAYRLARGGKQAFRLVFRPTGQGSFAETLHVEAEGGERTSGCVVRLVGTGLAATAPRQPAAPTVDETPAPVLAVAATPPPVAAPSPPPAAADSSAPHDHPAQADPGTFAVNDARVEAVQVRAVGATTLELAWKPPVPLPASYRVERRSFARDPDDPEGVRIDWNLCDRVDLRVHAGETTAVVRGLTPGEFTTLRVVSVDTAGRQAPPSPEIEATTLDASTWWHPSALKVLLPVLAFCLGLMARRRWQERQLVRELDARAEARAVGEPVLFTDGLSDPIHRTGRGSS